VAASKETISILHHRAQVARARRFGRAHATVAVVALALAGCAASSPRPQPNSTHWSVAARRAYVGATVIVSPEAAPIPDGVVLVDGDHIAAVGSRASVPIPRDAQVIECGGATITAAFWNTHVHFTQPGWRDAAHAQPARLAADVREFLTRWGFAHAVDTGSNREDTLALRDRIERGELPGPSIRTAGGTYVAVGGQPVYLRVRLPELATPEQARAVVAAELDGGSELIKVMTASVVAHPPPPVMPLPVVRAVTAAAHARGALVFAHPTNRAGVEAARDGGVDVLAHTAPAGGPWSEADARALVAAGVSLIPTVSLWRREIEADDRALADRFEAVAIDQVRVFAAAGGVLLFGTDAGYRPEFDPTAEHQLLARAGLTFAIRLAMLTTAPATRFHAARTGRLAPGLDADLVILDGDPRTDPAAFARVRLTLRRGIVLYAK
jgi:imidazolonepropionase-like amidohydrolase